MYNISYNLISFVQQHICFYRTTALAHPHTKARTNTHTHTHTHTSKSLCALPTVSIPYCPQHSRNLFHLPFSTVQSHFEYIHTHTSTFLIPEPVWLPACFYGLYMARPLRNFHAIFNTTLLPTIQPVNFIPVLFVMHFKLTRSAVYLSSLSQKEDSKWRCPNTKVGISNLISGTLSFEFRLSNLQFRLLFFFIDPQGKHQDGWCSV